MRTRLAKDRPERSARRMNHPFRQTGKRSEPAILDSRPSTSYSPFALAAEAIAALPHWQCFTSAGDKLCAGTAMNWRCATWPAGSHGRSANWTKRWTERRRGRTPSFFRKASRRILFSPCFAPGGQGRSLVPWKQANRHRTSAGCPRVLFISKPLRLRRMSRA